jgi:hypothetical protein
MKGVCLCESVAIDTNDVSEFEACHCGMCRRWGGGPFLAVHCGSEITVSGKEHVSIFSSSEWAERAFCKNCGTHLYYRLTQSDEYIVQLGLFHQENNFVFKQQIFIDRKPSFYTFSDDTKNLTEKEVFEQYEA